MNDGIRPIKVHPRTVEVMREIGMALTEMIIDENVPNDPQLAGIAVPKNFPWQEAIVEVVGETSPRWTWKRWDTATNAWHAKLETPNGVAHMDLMWPRGNAGVDIELRAWEQNWKHVIYDGGTIDQFMRMAEDWANKIIAHHGLTSSVTAKDVEQAWNDDQGDRKRLDDLIRLDEFLRETPGTGSPMGQNSTVDWAIDCIKDLLTSIREFRKSNETLVQAAISDEQLQRIGQLATENAQLKEANHALNSQNRAQKEAIRQAISSLTFGQEIGS